MMIICNELRTEFCSKVCIWSQKNERKGERKIDGEREDKKKKKVFRYTLMDSLSAEQDESKAAKSPVEFCSVSNGWSGGCDTHCLSSLLLPACLLT